MTKTDNVAVHETASLAPNPATAGILRVLQVEDDQFDGELVLHQLRRDGFEIHAEVVQTPAEFLQQVLANPPDIVLADYNLGQWRGVDTLEILRKEGLDIPVIVVSGALGDVKAVECIKQGATDYVLKDSLARLPTAVNRALQERQLRRQRLQAEADLELKIQELARSNQALEQFAYVASHDLQEPLRMVATYTQLLAERYRGKLDERADSYIHYAVEGATRMQTLIQDLLAFSRAGRPGTNFASVDCNLVMEDVLRNLHMAIQENGAVVKYDRLPVVRANHTQLTQVFQNLIRNALTFKAARAPVIEIGAESRGKDWVLSVADNGIGIAPENFDVIFEVFRRLNTRTQYPGNGIGLSICKKVIEQHGGKIWVGNNDSKDPNTGGTTFRFTLPAAEASAAASTTS